MLEMSLPMVSIHSWLASIPDTPLNRERSTCSALLLSVALVGASRSERCVGCVTGRAGRAGRTAGARPTSGAGGARRARRPGQGDTGYGRVGHGVVTHAQDRPVRSELDARDD